MEVKVVVGANFGDEGKGLMTDYFCHNAMIDSKKCAVVLCNGGPQRGHTVTTPNSNTHVFKHFGSGLAAGADTIITEDFLVNPMIFMQEYRELAKDEFFGKALYHSKCYVSKDCHFTTPFDMILNQLTEDSRGDNRHGSVGLGIWETILRYDRTNAYDFYTFSCMSRDSKEFYLKDSVRGYFIDEINSRGIKLDSEWLEIIYSDGLIENYINDTEEMLKYIELGVPDMYPMYDMLVFEMGQGLALDGEFNTDENMIHTTPSHTGCIIPIKIIEEYLLIDRCHNINIEVCYVSRTYLTRHGAGPMDFASLGKEVSREELSENISSDDTNVTGPYQGSLRYAKLDYYRMFMRASVDYSILLHSNLNSDNRITCRKTYAFTHANEYGRDKIDAVLKTDRIVEVYVSYNKSRNSVHHFVKGGSMNEW